MAQTVEKVTTVAGGYKGNGKPALSAALSNPIGLAQDKKGNIYISDPYNCQIRRIDQRGIISKFAGSITCGFSGDGGPAGYAQLAGPAGLAIDAQGNLLVADRGNLRIRKITRDGIISTIAGNGTYGYSGDGGPATQAALGYPIGVSVDGSGRVLIADTNNFVIRMVDTAGIIRTVAGNHTSGFSGDGGPATSAQISYVYAVAASDNGEFYIADGSANRVRKVDAAGIITTYAGNGYGGNTGSGGPAIDAAISFPEGLLLAAGKLYIGTGGNIWVVDQATQTINMIAGNGIGSPGFSGDGGPASSASLSYPRGMVIDSAGDLLFADSGNGRIRKIDMNQIVSTVAGGYLGDGGLATLASLNISYFGGHMAFDAAGNMYIADTYNNRIRKVSTAGVISTIAGTGASGYSGDGGPAVDATLYTPDAVAVNSSGEIFIADTASCAIRKVDGAGVITTLDTSNAFICPYAIAADRNGDIFVAVAFNGNVIYKITSDGTASVVAGVLGKPGYNGDGIPATQAYLNVPTGIAVDGAGNLYISDWGAQRVRKVDTTGTISTVAGTGSFGISSDGEAGTSAALANPLDVAVDSAGNVYIADSSSGRLRMVDSAGIIHSIAGPGTESGYNGNGLPATQTNVFADAVAVGPNGKVYFTDAVSQRARKIH